MQLKLQPLLRANFGQNSVYLLQSSAFSVVRSGKNVVERASRDNAVPFVYRRHSESISRRLLMTNKPLYKRILLKASGEALMGGQSFGIDVSVVDRIAKDIADAHDMGVEVGVVIGGGNIFRGVAVASRGGDRVTGDHMGMLATAINSLALRTSLTKLGVEVVVLSAIAMPQICESFSQRKAVGYISQGKVVIFAGGTGNPFFTTDSAAALRAAEIGADVLLKATQVDGIYSADPKKDPNAKRYDRLTHEEVIRKGLAVMDTTAITLARENHIPIIVYSISEKGGLANVLNGTGRYTVVSE